MKTTYINATTTIKLREYTCIIIFKQLGIAQRNFNIFHAVYRILRSCILNKNYNNQHNSNGTKFGYLNDVMFVNGITFESSHKQQVPGKEQSKGNKTVGLTMNVKKTS